MKNEQKISKKEKTKRVAALGLTVALIITGIFAFLTATDYKENTFKLGKVDVQLYEAFDANQDGIIKLSNDDVFSKEDYEYKNASEEYIQTSNGEVYTSDVPSIRTEKIIPSQIIEKAPWAVNTGDNDAYIYMRVGIPVDSVSTESRGQDGYYHPDEGGTAHEVEMFTLLDNDKNPGVNDGWVLIPYSDEADYEVGEEDDVTYHYYVYGYTEGENADAIVEPDQATDDLFNYVKFVNYDNEESGYSATPIFMPYTLDILEAEGEEPYEEVYGYSRLSEDGTILDNNYVLIQALSTKTLRNIGDTIEEIYTFALTNPTPEEIEEFEEREDIFFAGGQMFTNMYYANSFIKLGMFEDKLDDAGPIERLCETVLTTERRDGVEYRLSNDKNNYYNNETANSIVTDLINKWYEKSQNVFITLDEEPVFGITNEEFHTELTEIMGSPVVCQGEEDTETLAELLKMYSFTEIINLKLYTGYRCEKVTYDDFVKYTKELESRSETETISIDDEILNTKNDNYKYAEYFEYFIEFPSKTLTTYGVFGPKDTGSNERDYWKTWLFTLSEDITEPSFTNENEFCQFLNENGLGIWYNIFYAYNTRENSTDPLTISSETSSTAQVQTGYNGRPSENKNIEQGLYATYWSEALTIANDDFRTKDFSNIASEYKIPINVYAAQTNTKKYNATSTTKTITPVTKTAYLFGYNEEKYASAYETEQTKLEAEVNSKEISDYSIEKVPFDYTYSDYIETTTSCYYNASAENPFSMDNFDDITSEEEIDWGTFEFGEYVALVSDGVYFARVGDTYKNMGWVADEEIIPITDTDLFIIYPSVKNIIGPEACTEEPGENDDISLVVCDESIVMAAYVSGDKTWDLSEYGMGTYQGEGLYIYTPYGTTYNGDLTGFTETSIKTMNGSELWVKIPGTWSYEETLSGLGINSLSITEDGSTSSKYIDTNGEQTSSGPFNFINSDVTFSSGTHAAYVSHDTNIINIQSGTVTHNGIVMEGPGLYIKVVGNHSYNNDEGSVIYKTTEGEPKTINTFSNNTTNLCGNTNTETLSNVWEYATDKANW